MKPETQFRQAQVIPFLKTLKCTVYFPVQQVAIVGTPDMLLCCRGRFVALELKSRGGTLSPLQKYNLDRVSARGGVAIVASPDNWAGVKSVLTALDEGEEDDHIKILRASGVQF